jgi:hypothetical protein
VDAPGNPDRCDPHDIVAHVSRLREIVKQRRLHFFWIMPERRNSFRPIVLCEEEMRKEILDNLPKYGGKQLANVVCRVAPDPQSAIANGKYLLRFSVTVSSIREDGDVSISNEASMVTVNYYEEDLLERKFAFKDMERFVKMCAEGKVTSSALGGRSFGEHMKVFKNKGIDFDTLYIRDSTDVSASAPAATNTPSDVRVEDIADGLAAAAAEEVHRGSLPYLTVLYLMRLEQKLYEKGLDEFWVLTDSEDFKPIKKEKNDIKRMLQEKAQYYRGKKIAKISLFVRKSGLIKKEWVFAVVVTVFEIHDDGSFETNRGMVGALKVSYLADDLQMKRFTLKDAVHMMRYAASREITSDSIAGMSYKKYKMFVNQIERGRKRRESENAASIIE